ncbi:hypothetical protein SCLCIDRAFT_788326 [Scleroderma citrinum Foug A]|uniref:Uncharacterized protein n=1 Tax=Scleroderma citrinum Foug A TaxID=1036808 RepID=A0A0C2ZMA8_9AGAM|nr:hypothetical protein SCLCIDRAFT_788326 [Scleroderma citrinum Foug A]
MEVYGKCKQSIPGATASATYTCNFARAWRPKLKRRECIRAPLLPTIKPKLCINLFPTVYLTTSHTSSSTIFIHGTLEAIEAGLDESSLFYRSAHEHFTSRWSFMPGRHIPSEPRYI